MLGAGFTRDWKQCRDKLKNLKVGYKAVKDHNGLLGKGHKMCCFFKQLDEILGTQAATTPPQVLASSQTRPAEEESNCEQLDSESQPLGDVEDDGASGEVLETPVSTPSLTLTSQNTKESREVGGKRELDSKQELAAKRSKVVRDKKMLLIKKAPRGVMQDFNAYQEKAEERFLRFEEQRRKEKREHEKK